MDARHVIRACLPAWACFALAAQACEVPDEGNMPFRRAVSRVEQRPEAIRWAEQSRAAGELVQIVVHLDRPRSFGGRCYWTVEARAGGRLWKTFLVSPDGRRVRDEASR